MQYRWQVPAGIALPPGADSETLIHALLQRRGYATPEERRGFLNPTPRTMADPLLFADLDRAIARLQRAHANQELVAVWGDYDVDGLTSTALLTRALRGMGLRVRPFVPHRIHDGYGLNKPGIDRLLTEKVDLLVSVDCGVSDREPIAHAANQGLDVIVLDHHTVPETLPDAVAVVNPRRADCAYPYKDLAAVGVAYALVRALVAAGFTLQGAWAEDEIDLIELLELAALGTVADVAPLTGENRAMVAWGLDALRHTTMPGLQALYQVAGLDSRRLSAWDIGHAIGPRLNAAGRIADATLALNLLLAESYAEALPLAEELDTLNRERRRELTRILEEAIALVEEAGPPDETMPILQIEGKGWTAGVVGLVAGRLTERYGRPAIVLERGEHTSKGSARSIAEFNVIEALADCADLLEHYGGHARAAGLTIANDKLEELRERLLHRARALLTADDLRPTLTLDLELPLADLGYQTVRALEQLEPFGQGNPEPLMLVRGVGVKWPKTSVDGKHLFFTAYSQDGRPVRAPIRCVAFGQGERRSELLPAGTRIDVAGLLRREFWQGEERLSFHVRDFRPAS